MRPSHDLLTYLLLPFAISARPRLNGYAIITSTEYARTRSQLDFDTTRFNIPTPIGNWELPPTALYWR